MLHGRRNLPSAVSTSNVGDSMESPTLLLHLCDASGDFAFD